MDVVGSGEGRALEEALLELFDFGGNSEEFPASLKDNLQRLRIVDVRYDRAITNELRYKDLMDGLPAGAAKIISSYDQALKSGYELVWERGIIELT